MGAQFVLLMACGRGSDSISHMHVGCKCEVQVTLLGKTLLIGNIDVIGQ